MSKNYNRVIKFLNFKNLKTIIKTLICMTFYLKRNNIVVTGGSGRLGKLLQKI